MLHDAKALENFSIHAIDGDVGTVKDVYFDDEKWVVRYLVVDTGGWLTGRKVLLSPISFQHIDWENKKLHVNLTREKIENSPGTYAHQPVSRQEEEELYRHYGYPDYWGGPYAWGFAVFPAMVEQQIFDAPERHEAREEMEQTRKQDVHLRSCNAVSGYSISVTDGSHGHIEDFLFDEEDWSIQYLVIDPRDYWPGKHVLLPVQRVQHVYANDKSVVVDISGSELESSLRYDPDNLPPSPARTARAINGSGRANSSGGSGARPGV